MRTTAAWTAALPRANIGEMRSLSDPATLVVDFFENYLRGHSEGGFGMASMGGLLPFDGARYFETIFQSRHAGNVDKEECCRGALGQEEFVWLCDTMCKTLQKRKTAPGGAALSGAVLAC